MVCSFIEFEVEDVNVRALDLRKCGIIGRSAFCVCVTAYVCDPSHGVLALPMHLAAYVPAFPMASTRLSLILSLLLGFSVLTSVFLSVFFSVFADTVLGVACHPSRRIIASSGSVKDKTIRIWSDEH